MRNHPAEGARLVSPTPLNELTPVILQHQERWDDSLPPREVLRRIEEGRGTQFDPELADSFLALHRPLR